MYLVSVALLFIGSMWGMRTLGSFREGMASRVFQGLGWGAFDTLVLASIYDTYFVGPHLLEPKADEVGEKY